MHVLFDALLDSLVLCSFGVRTSKLRGDRLGMVCKTAELYRYLATTLLSYYQCTYESDPAAHVAMRACQCNCLHGTISRPRTLAKC